MRALSWTLFLLLVLLQYQLWFAEGGVRQVMVLKEKVAKQSAVNQTLEKQNKELASDVLDLQKGTAMIEQFARSELGMIKPGESFFLVVKDKKHEQ